jgi:putative transposase
MARPLRVEYEGAMYHVIVRGNERRAVFLDDSDRERYLRRLAHYRERFGFRLYAFCLMSNHVHLAIRSGKEPLSRIMRGLQGSYTQAFNRRHRRAGHLFQGRYKAFLVQEDPYLLGLVRYIHENPMRARIVDRPELYEWSSDRWYRKGRGPEWLDVDPVLSMLGRGRKAAVAAYRRLMSRQIGRDYQEAPVTGQLVKGDEEFATQVLASKEDPELLRRGVTVERICRAVSRALDLPLTELRSPSRIRTLARGRAIAGHVGKRVGRIPLARTAEFLGRDRSTLARDVGHLESELRSSRGDRQVVDQIIQSLGRAHAPKLIHQFSTDPRRIRENA